MLFGDVLRSLQNGTLAMETLVAMNDLALLARIRNAAGLRGETPGGYAVNSVRGFANRAGDEDWLALVTAIENSNDAGQTCLSRMIDWAMRHEVAPQTHREGVVMSGRRPLIKGYFSALHGSWVRSCLRPVYADSSVRGP